MPPPEKMALLANDIVLRFAIGTEHADALANFLRESVGQFHPSRTIKSAVKRQTDLREELGAAAEAHRSGFELTETAGGS
jgi:hypothetical protein